MSDSNSHRSFSDQVIRTGLLVILALVMIACDGGSSSPTSKDSESKPEKVILPSLVQYFPDSGPAGSAVYLQFSESLIQISSNLEATFNEEPVVIKGYTEDIAEIFIPPNAVPGSTGIIQIQTTDSKAPRITFNVTKPKAIRITSQTIEPSGTEQVIGYEDTLKLTIPAGLIDQPRNLTIDVIDNAPPSSLNPFNRVAVDITIDGLTQLDKTIEIAMAYNTNGLNPDYGPGEQLFAQRFDSDTGLWVDLPLQVDEETQTAYIYTDHLSYIALVGTAAGLMTAYSPAAVATGVGVTGAVAASGWIAEKIAYSTYTTPQGNFRIVYRNYATPDSSDIDNWQKPALAAGLTGYNSKYPKYVQDAGELLEVAYQNYIHAGLKRPGSRILDIPQATTVKISGVWQTATGDLLKDWRGIGDGDQPQYGKIFRAVHLPLSIFTDGSINNNDLIIIGHELFHRFQAEYYTIRRFLSWENTGDYWWIEATAEYAGHNVAWGNLTLDGLDALVQGNLLSYPIDSTGIKADWGRDYEYVSATFVDHLVRKQGVDFGELIEFVARGEPKAQLNQFAASSQTGGSLGWWYHQFARDTALTNMYLSSFPPANFNLPPSASAEYLYNFQVAEANDILHLPEEAFMEIAVDGDPSIVDIVVIPDGKEFAEADFTTFLSGRPPQQWQLQTWQINSLNPGDTIYILATNDGFYGEEHYVNASIMVDHQKSTEEGSETLVSHQFYLPGKYSAKLWAVQIGQATLSIDPDTLNEALPDEEYAFYLNIEDIPKNTNKIEILWSFTGADGEISQDQASVPVSENGTATYTIRHTFKEVAEEGLSLLVTVQDKETASELARVTVPIMFPFKVTITGPRILVWELTGGASEVTQNFEAMAVPEAYYEYRWIFGDGNTQIDKPLPGERSSVSHTYANLSAGDKLYPRIELWDLTGKKLAEDTVSIHVEQKKESDHDMERIELLQSIDCGWDVDYSILEYAGDDRGEGGFWYRVPYLYTVQHGVHIRLRDYQSSPFEIVQTCWHVHPDIENANVDHGNYYGSLKHGVSRIWLSDGTQTAEILYRENKHLYVLDQRDLESNQPWCAITDYVDNNFTRHEGSCPWVVPSPYPGYIESSE
ncbi:hypothetical protein LZ24_01237 [Desulfobotulus alkaliphilus]|uniref:PKD domain-containing protein n=1 Tax=Desulfobotulus alkaliphilus TaxID=622671 RepID=A0A562RY69_9BACT|nr:hypothetical protein [Desulfobotulus alkaliphilus]TWI74007.1 hypothetical protein LZ24_01237 [Desulfobotulus alkaliphilus]